MDDSFYEYIFEESPIPIAIHDPDTSRFVQVNQSYADALGYDPTALEGRLLTDIAQEDRGIALQAAIEGALDGTTERLQTEVTDWSGTPRQVTLVLTSIIGGHQTYLLSTFRGVGERKDDDPPTAPKRRLEIALAGTNTGVWEWNMETDEVIWTESMERLFGLEPGTFEGTFDAFAERVHPDDLQTVQTAIETAIKEGEMFQTEYRIRRDDGKQRWVQARGELQETDNGPGQFIGILTDITGSKNTEQALHQQERQYRQLVERLPDAYYTIDSDMRLTFCNEALADRLGYPVETVEGELIWDLLPEAKGSVLERRFQQVMDRETPQTFEYEYEAGGVVRIQAYPYDDGIAALSTDITDQREALASILDATPVVLYRLDSDGVFQDVRGEMLSKLGLDPEDLIGESVFDVYAESEDVTAAASRALEGESFRFTLTLGDITLETQYKPVYSDGEVTGAIGVSMDITELQRQRERMEFFNSILRHDVLNGMTVIKIRAELLTEELDGDHRRYAQTILDWCDTTTEVTKRVRQVVETLATPEEEHRLEPVDVSAVLEQKLQTLERAYPEVTFTAAVRDGVYVHGDKLLEDVLGNVLTNSIEHNDTEGLRIETAVEVEDDTVSIRIADNGRGVPDDRKESIFRRGETSHAKETGSGFGLFFVDVMIEKYGGEIRVEDSDAGGACFHIELVAEETH